LSDRRWTVACGIAGALLAVALSWDFFALSLDPWPDQAWILLAAERHHRGLGLTTVLDGAGDDLAVTDYRRLVYFPPGYPLLVSAMRATGLPIAAIVKIINAAALVAGFGGWMLLAGRFLASRWARLLFALLLVLACRGTIPKGGTTDYVFWALLPYWILAVLAGVSRRRYGWLLAAGALAAVMIGFRWAAVVLVVAGCAVILLEWGVRGAAVYGAIPTATFVAISLANRALSGRASSILSYVKPSWHFDLLANYYPLEGAFARPVALEPLLSRAWRALDPPMSSAGLALLFRLIVPVALMAIVMFFASAKRTALSQLVALTYAALVAMLAYMTVRYTWSGVRWSYLDEPRYYLPFFPAIALFWLVVGESVRSAAARRAFLALLVVAVLYLGQAEARWTATRLHEGEPDTPLLAQLRAIAGGPAKRSVVFDIDISRYLLWDSDHFSPRLYPDAASTARLRASKPVDVWIVERVGRSTPYMSDPQFDRRRLDALRERFHPRLAWTSGDGRFRLYRAVL
jgi:hypothetical protein